jgi:hypothetical protein
VIGSALTYLAVHITDIMFNNVAAAFVVGIMGVGIGMFSLFELASFKPES